MLTYHQNWEGGYMTLVEISDKWIGTQWRYRSQELEEYSAFPCRHYILLTHLHNHTLCLFTLTVPLNSLWPQSAIFFTFVILIISNALVLWIYQDYWSVSFLSPHLFWFHFLPYLANLLSWQYSVLPCLAEAEPQIILFSLLLH